MTLDEIKCPVVHATLEVLVMHLGRVAEAANRMDIDNLGLLFGQVMMREGKGTRQKLLREGFKKSKWKFKMAFAIRGPTPPP